MNPDFSMPLPIIGRKNELKEIKRAMKSVIDGRGWIYMISGEPGIGKTRLVEELALCGEDQGLLVLSGRCYKEQGTPPYWPWVQAIRSYLAVVNADTLGEDLGHNAAMVATIFPEIREILLDISPYDPGVQDPIAIRFWIIDAVVAFLTGLSSRRPMMIVLDDLHWADESSLNLLIFLARRLKQSHLLILGTYRDGESKAGIGGGHSAGEALDEIEREHRYRRFHLDGLSLFEVTQFLHQQSGTTMSGEVCQVIFDLTGGNPLYVGQMVQLLVRDAAGGDGRLPDGLRDAIGKRLDFLSEECNKMLAVASLLGQEFHLPELQQVTRDLSAEALGKALDEAVEAHILEEIRGRTGWLRFSHALVRESLVDRLPLSKRNGIHADIVERLEALYNGNLSPHYERLTEHSSRAVMLLGIDRLVHYALLSGEQAIERFTFETASTYFQMGLQALGGGALSKEKAALLLGYGRSQAAMGMFDEAIGSLSGAMDYYEKERDAKTVAAICAFKVCDPGSVELCRRALSVVPPDTIEFGYILALCGNSLMCFRPDGTAGREMLQKALNIALKLKHGHLEMRVHTLWAMGAWMQFRAQECLEHSLAAMELSRSIYDSFTVVSSRCYCIDVLGMQGRWKELAHQTQMLRQEERKTRDRDLLKQIHFASGRFAQRAGDWATARLHSDARTDLGDTFLTPFYRSQIEYQTGHLDEGMRTAEKMFELLSQKPDFSARFAFAALLVAQIACITGELSNFASAEGWVNAVFSDPCRCPIIENTARLALGLLYVLRNDVEDAVEQRALLMTQLEDLREDEPFGVPVHSRHEPYGEFFALCARAEGRHDEAVNHLRLTHGLTKIDKPRSAWLDFELAEVLLERGKTGDEAEAKTLLVRASETAGALGMPPLEARIRERLAKVRARTGGAFPNGLSRREVDVIAHLALGKTDQEIAAELFISVKTVSNHVARILRKTGTANRTGAANFAAKCGLARQ